MNWPRCAGPHEQVAVGVHCPVFAWTTAADAWRLVEPHLHYSEWKYADMVAQPYAARADGPSGPPELTDATRDRLRVGALVGTVAEVADGIAAYARRRRPSVPLHRPALLARHGSGADAPGAGGVLRAGHTGRPCAGGQLMTDDH